MKQLQKNKDICIYRREGKEKVGAFIEKIRMRGVGEMTNGWFIDGWMDSGYGDDYKWQARALEDFTFGGDNLITPTDPRHTQKKKKT